MSHDLDADAWPLVAFVLGGLTGLSLAILFAPSAGTESRRRIGEGARRGASAARKAATSGAQRTRQAAARTRDAARRATGRGKGGPTPAAEG